MKLPVLTRLWRRVYARPFSFVHFIRRLPIVLATAFAGFGCLVIIAMIGLRFERFVRESQYFQVEKIEIVGASESLEAEIRAAIENPDVKKDGNLLLMRMPRVRYEVEVIPRVRSYHVAKVFPRTLRIEVQERKPLAAVNVGAFYWMDREGHLLGEAAAGEVVASKSPIITGVRGSRFRAGMKIEQPMLGEALATIEFLEEFDLALLRHFAEWHLTPENELTGILREGVEVRFGEGDPLKRLPILATALRAKPDWERYTYMDLRFESQVVYF